MQYFAGKELNKIIPPVLNYTGGIFMSKRITSLLCVLVFLLSAVMGRCFMLAQSKAYAVSDSYNSYTINISKLYTNIYSNKGDLLNNNTSSMTAVIRPNEKCLSELKLLFDSEEVREITSELSNGYPIIRKIDKYARTNYIKIVETKNQNSDNMLCKHLINKDYGGIEQYIDKEIGSLSVNFSVDALGRILSGDEGRIVDDNYDSVDGIVISIDKEIQQIAEDAAKSIPKGSVVVMDTETSQVLASVSRGDDYINRSISPYAVGSVFKTVVCICAIENNIDLSYKCVSSTKVGDTVFNCQKNRSHGMQTMREALANSCNCYFVNLALKLGSDKIYETAKELGFGSVFELYDNWDVSAGTLSSRENLNSKGQLALVGFGQGVLTDSPLHFASVVSCIANGGFYNSPVLDIKESNNKRVIKDSTAKKLRDYMKYVVTNGTGASADYKNSVAGKTATAQSGIYENEREILNTWFTGFYPYKNPKYAIVIMREDGQSGAGDCCPVFRSIVEKIDKL